ncbi:2-amino-4-hydroxy-6-hydroxymethyldihydropteridine diphosphokinase [Marinicella sediminis]|uniref:2-amino-4-hydroxy-6-hydroxymethyldihydropteridine diphosphokinase n=1 Tax=Marinicella sediminis TaxID=1792834 RepID=A0ABV7J424_9GAMM|nr:2-amino-4-hydroxy-6-hydroxymethyldihydropteridine diphosphokinase [Marinicella sediminis]
MNSRTFYLGIGSNVDRQLHITSCLHHLRCAFSRLQTSPVYASPSYGFKGADFHNLVVRIDTAFTPTELKIWLQQLEDLHGRDRRKPRYSDRTLDVDLLLCDQLIIDDGFVQLPRDEILKRPYVLKPLQDLAPDLLHPVAKKRLADLWQAFCQTNEFDLKPVTYR